jgi:hypothetical protein
MAHTSKMLYGAIFALSLLNGCDESTAPRQDSAPTPTPRRTPMAGDTISLRVGNLEMILVATDKPSLDRMIQLASAKDNLGLMQLAASGKAIWVDSGTPAKIIDSGWTWAELRIMGGEHVGKSVFVPSGFIE